MKLAFNGKAHYPNLEEGYALYAERTRKNGYLSKEQYNKVIKLYCSTLADRLLKEGMVDLPGDIGSICASIFDRKPQYRGKKFIGYGKMDYSTGFYDGIMRTFGIVFIPKRSKNANLRSYGFVANRRLFKKVKSLYESDDCTWEPIEFNDEMI